MPQKARRVGAYAKLLANYASDDAIIEAGEAAELLFVRGLAFCATSDSDGYITDSQVARYVGAGMRDAVKRAETLARVGVWERAPGGYVVRSWTKVHESADEKGRRRANDRERKRVQANADSERNPDGIQTEGAPESLSLIHDRAETRHDTTKQSGKQVRGERPEILARLALQTPPCSEHGWENADGPCHGCRRVNEAIRYAEAADQARIAALIAECQVCDDAGREMDDDNRITGRGCSYHETFQTPERVA